jgi:hypothetical protein
VFLAGCAGVSRESAPAATACPELLGQCHVSPSFFSRLSWVEAGSKTTVQSIAVRYLALRTATPQAGLFSADRLRESSCSLHCSFSRAGGPTSTGTIPTRQKTQSPGEVAEWSNVPDSKSGVDANLPRVRIPPSPPEQVLPTRSVELPGAQSPAPRGAFCYGLLTDPMATHSRNPSQTPFRLRTS